MEKIKLIENTEVTNKEVIDKISEFINYLAEKDFNAVLSVEVEKDKYVSFAHGEDKEIAKALAGFFNEAVKLKNGFALGIIKYLIPSLSYIFRMSK